MSIRPGRWLRGLNGLVRARGLIGIHLAAQVSIRGTFEFGRGVSIGRDSIVQVPPNARLVLGAGVHVGRGVELTPESSIEIGRHTSIQDRCQLLGNVAVGAHCVFAPNVFASSGTHEFRERPSWLIRDQDALMADPTYRAAAPRHRPIRIDEDCWIGINAVIMRGVVVGRGSIVGANAVVTHCVEPYSVVAGAPARLIGRRLEFRPPRTISSAEPSDWPYFYAGFDLRQRIVGPTPASLPAYGRFELALDRSGARRLRLSVLASEPLELLHGRERQAVSAGEHEVNFELDPESIGALVVSVLDGCGRPCAVGVRRASLEG